MNKYTPQSAILNVNDIKRKKIVFTEKNRRYECANDTQEDVVMFHIDGGFFPASDTTIRCDYGYELEGSNGNRTCLVELKGHNIKHACEQLYQTLRYFEKKYPVKKFFCRIVTSGNKKPNIESAEEKKLSAYLRKKNYGAIKVETNKIFEKTSEVK